MQSGIPEKVQRGDSLRQKDVAGQMEDANMLSFAPSEVVEYFYCFKKIVIPVRRLCPLD